MLLLTISVEMNRGKPGAETLSTASDSIEDPEPEVEQAPTAAGKGSGTITFYAFSLACFLVFYGKQ